MMNPIVNVPDIFGSDVFTEATMKQRLPASAYESWKQCIEDGTPLPLDTANEIAEAMKVWATERAQPIIRTGSSP